MYIVPGQAGLLRGHDMDPYIGITDFASIEQVQNMLKVLAENQTRGSTRKLHVGVMMSYKTLHGIPSSWLDVFPRKEKVAGILSSPYAYNCLHYADYEENAVIWKSIVKAIGYGGEGIDALQLDMIWPDSRQIARALRHAPKKVEIILQIGRKALEKMNNDPRQVITKLREYDGIVDRVLLDKSGGEGKGMDARSLLPFAHAIRNKFPEIGLGAAGGLGPETIELVRLLAEAFPDLSIDAQGRLRPSGDAHDPIDWTMAGNYLIQALRLFSSI